LKGKLALTAHLEGSMTKKVYLVLALLVTYLVISRMVSAQVAEAWVARYDGPASSHDRAYSIAADANGNIYVTGCSLGSGTDYDYATIKYRFVDTGLIRIMLQ
jgi:hypothetical protein